MVAGAVSAEQADVIVATVDELPGAQHLRRRVEKALLRHARRFALIHVLDPDRTERRLEAQLERDLRAAHGGRFLTIADDGAGGIRLRGRGSVEDGAVIKAALLPLTCPSPAVDDHDGSGPVHGPRDSGARTWDALVETWHHLLDTGRAPDCHGTPPRLIVTVGLEALKERVDATAGTDLLLGRTGDGLERAARGARSEVLDVGRASRTVPVTIWTALVARDQHCAFPGCTRAPLMCHAHHLRHWADQGETSLHNLALLCGHHHRVLHHTPWRIRLDPEDRRPEFSPPPRRGESRTWIRFRARGSG
jgi:hypothetical protein